MGDGKRAEAASLAEQDSATIDSSHRRDERIAKGKDRSSRKKGKKRSAAKLSKKRSTAWSERAGRIGLAGALLGVGALMGAVMGSATARTDRR
jgi:hypothetical protein